MRAKLRVWLIDLLVPPWFRRGRSPEFPFDPSCYQIGVDWGLKDDEWAMVSTHKRSDGTVEILDTWTSQDDTQRIKCIAWDDPSRESAWEYRLDETEFNALYYDRWENDNDFPPTD